MSEDAQHADAPQTDPQNDTENGSENGSGHDRGPGKDSASDPQSIGEMEDAPGGISDDQLPEDLRPDGTNEPEPAMDEHGQPRETDENEGMSLSDRDDLG